MTVLQNATAIGFGLTVPFLGVGGTPPYSYAVVPGGAGGTIDPVSGLYTSPNISGEDIIEVTDSLLATASASISVLSAIQLFCDILEYELDLDDDQVVLYDQKFNIPNDSRLYIAVGVLTSKPFSNNNAALATLPGLDESQSVNVHAILNIDLYSRSTEALDRKEEVVMALKSVYAQQQMNLNAFFIGSIPTTFVALNQEDGAAIPYHFSISVGFQYKVVKSKPIEYYDTFFDTADAPEVVPDP